MSRLLSTIQASELGTRTSTRTLGELLGMKTTGTKTTAAQPFPLIKVVARTQIIGDCASTTIEEHYANPHKHPMDVTHTIPLPANSAVIAFSITAGERHVKGVCKKIAEARADFDSAKARGKTAAIVESVRDDVHAIRLTNVPPKTAVIVRMHIVERLRVDDGRFEFRLPTTISPKYVPGNAVGHEGEGTSPDTDHAPDASRLTPPIRLKGGTQLDFEITLAAGATDIASSHALTREDDADGTIRLRPAAGAVCDRDIVVRLWGRGNDAITRAYTDGDRTLVVVDPPARRKSELEKPREAVFVLDRSGSMAGGRLEAAKRALTRALAGLSSRDTFSIIAFDTDVEMFSTEPFPATTKALTKARAWLAAINARGGTESIPALTAACVGSVAASFVRTVLFLTDGDVANDSEILELTRQFDPATRLFVVGIGMAPSMTLLERLARLGGGTHTFIGDGDDVEAEITRFEAAFAGPIASGLGESNARTRDSHDLFAGRAAVFFLDGERTHVTIDSADGRFNAQCTVQRTTMPLGALWARDRVQELEDRIISHPRDRDVLEPEIVALGIEHQLQTRLTSFVAVDEQSQVEGEAIEIVQPVDADARVFWASGGDGSELYAPPRGLASFMRHPPESAQDHCSDFCADLPVSPIAPDLEWPLSRHPACQRVIAQFGSGTAAQREALSLQELLLVALTLMGQSGPKRTRQLVILRALLKAHEHTMGVTGFLDALDEERCDLMVSTALTITGHKVFRDFLDAIG